MNLHVTSVALPGEKFPDSGSRTPIQGIRRDNETESSHDLSTISKTYLSHSLARTARDSFAIEKATYFEFELRDIVWGYLSGGRLIGLSVTGRRLMQMVVQYC